MSLEGHFRQIDPLPTLSACPLRFDRVLTFAPQRFDAVCQQRTNAPQQKSPHSIIGRQFPNHEVGFLCIVRQDGFLAVKYLTGLGRLHAQSTFL